MTHAGTTNTDQANPSRPRWWHCLGAALFYTAATILAFPPFSLWPCTFLAPLGLMWLGLNAGPRPNRAAWIAALGVAPFWAFEMRYIADMTGAGYIPLALWQSTYTWLFVWSLARCRRALPRVPVALLVAVLWVSVCFLQGDIVFTGFPWYHLAHPLIDVPLLIGPARIVGAYGLTLLVAAACASIVVLAARGTRRQALVSLVVIVAAWAGLSWPTGEPSPERTVRVAMVQTNLPQDNKNSWPFEQRLADMARFEALTRRAAQGVGASAAKPDVIVWPETMFPGFWLDPGAVAAQREAGLGVPVERDGRREYIPTTIFAEQLLALQKEIGIPMVVGGIGVENFRILAGKDGGPVQFKQDARYNSAFLITGGRVSEPRYDKIALTPFGEVMPGIQYWPWLQRQMLSLAANGMQFDLSPGRGPVTLDIPTGSGVLRMATPICFELTRGQFCHELVYGPAGRRADLLVNLTNDGWFSTADSGREQHLQLARWRCLELGTPMIRSANTGISAVIDERGRVLAQGVDGQAKTMNIDGVLSYTLQLRTVPTFFARHGDLVRWPVLALAGCAAGGAAGVGLRRRARAGVAEGRSS